MKNLKGHSTRKDKNHCSKVFYKGSELLGGVTLLFSRRPWLMLGAHTENGSLLVVHIATYRDAGPGVVSMEELSH